MSQQTKLIELISDRLNAEADAIRLQWTGPEGTATRHFVVDDLLPQATAMEIFGAFPTGSDGFVGRESFRERKWTSAQLSDHPPILSDITYALQSETIVNLVAELVEMEAVEPDPKLYAGGLSMMFRGDFLNPHIDNSHDADRERYRRLNLLYYVAPDWKLEDGGNFELWDEDGKHPKTIVSRFNRLVVMETNKTSLHSVSPLVADGPRCCVSNYYFSKISPDGSEYFHVTSFTGRPEQSARRLIGSADNALRNVAAKVLGSGRGKHLVNK